MSIPFSNKATPPCLIPDPGPEKNPLLTVNVTTASGDLVISGARSAGLFRVQSIIIHLRERYSICSMVFNIGERLRSNIEICFAGVYFLMAYFRHSTDTVVCLTIFNNTIRIKGA